MIRDLIFAELKKTVGERRLPHILGTEDECLRLASYFRLSDTDTEKLQTAALLHDVTKSFSREAHLAVLRRTGSDASALYLPSEKTWHAVTGALYAAEAFPSVVDDVVLTAIRYHTTGRASMTLLEKLLYLADYIEPTRTFPDCVRLRQFFYEAIASGEAPDAVLTKTLILSFDMTIHDLVRLRCPIHPDTVAARNDLLSKE